MAVIAVTDHDTQSGIKEAMREGERLGIPVIPGIEISAEDGRSIHILGYGVDENAARLKDFSKEMRSARLRRITGMADKLSNLGMTVPLDEILRGAGDIVGRPHIARAMIARGYVDTMQEAFDRWLARGKPAYVPREKLTVEKAAKLILSEGAVPVLAHPSLLGLPDETLLPLIRQWQAQGIMGIEVYHPSNRGRFAFFEALARKNSLLVTGGSDYHNDERGTIGETSGDWKTAEEDVRALLSAIESVRKQRNTHSAQGKEKSNNTHNA